MRYVVIYLVLILVVSGFCTAQTTKKIIGSNTSKKQTKAVTTDSAKKQPLPVNLLTPVKFNRNSTPSNQLKRTQSKANYQKITSIGYYSYFDFINYYKTVIENQQPTLNSSGKFKNNNDPGYQWQVEDFYRYYGIK